VRAFAIIRTVLTRTLSTPGGVLGVLALLSALPVFLVLAPTGVSSRNADPSALSYEVAFIGQFVGVVLGLSALERIAPVLAREPSGARLAWETFALLASGLIGAALPLLSGLVCGASSLACAPGIPILRILPPLMTAVTAGTMLARLCPTPGMAPWLCASGILLAPMILSPSTSSSSLIAMAVGFLLAAWLLDHSPIAAGGTRTWREAR
jgi:hypothetical protein